MGIQQDPRIDGHGVPERYPASQSKNFFSSDENLLQLSETLESILCPYNVEICSKSLNRLDGYDEHLEWFKSERKNGNFEEVIEILELAKIRAIEIIAKNKGE